MLAVDVVEKTYGLGAILDLLENDWDKLGSRYERRDDGIYLREWNKEDRAGLSPKEAEALRTHPSGDPYAPALPASFTAAQFVAFARSHHLLEGDLICCYANAQKAQDAGDEPDKYSPGADIVPNEKALSELRAINRQSEELVRALLAAPGTSGVLDRHGRPESREERLAWVLALYDEEVQRRGEYGALARVVLRDGRARQTVAADLQAARKARAEARAMDLMTKALEK